MFDPTFTDLKTSATTKAPRISRVVLLVSIGCVFVGAALLAYAVRPAASKAVVCESEWESFPEARVTVIYKMPIECDTIYKFSEEETLRDALPVPLEPKIPDKIPTPREKPKQ